MMKLIIAEMEAFDKLSHALLFVVEHQPSTPLAIKPLEQRLFQLGHTTGVTLAIAAITEYRAALTLAMREAAGA